MSEIWHVMSFEYRRHVFRKRFLLGLLSLPLFIGIMALVVLLLIRSEINLKPIGYVDKSGTLMNPRVLSNQADLSGGPWLISFETEDLANEALQADQIQAYYVISPDYVETRQAKFIANQEPSSLAMDQFNQFMRANLLAEYPSEIVHRLTAGNRLVVRSVDGTRQFIQGDWLGIVLPFLVGFIFLISVFATSGYLLQAVVEEKQNKTMEVLVTSTSPMKMMIGKTLGIVAVGLTQLAVWAGLALLLLLVGSRIIDISSWLSIPFEFIVLVVAVFIPAFVMLSALMITVGATLTDVQEAQQVTSLFTLPLFIPFWFVLQIINHPNGPVAVGLSFFPFTAPITIAIRYGIAQIPTWQIALSLGMLVVWAVLAIWLAGRAFRLGMLRYGQRVAWREILGIRVDGHLK